MCFSIQYRLATHTSENEVHEDGITVAECFEDCKSAIRFIRKNAFKFGIDPDKIAAGGDSAGGHLAVSLGTLEGFDSPQDDLSVSAVPNAVVDCSGIIDMTLKWKKMIPFRCLPENEKDEVACWNERQKRAWAMSPI